jgi:hypothetical protein
MTPPGNAWDSGSQAADLNTPETFDYGQPQRPTLVAEADAPSTPAEYFLADMLHMTLDGYYTCQIGLIRLSMSAASVSGRTFKIA